MWTEIGILCFIVVLFPDSIESMWLCCSKPKTKENLVELCARNIYETPTVKKRINAGAHKVGVVNIGGTDYVIGLVEKHGTEQKLFPFYFAANLENSREEISRIKIRIDDVRRKAYVYQPIIQLETELLGLFFNRYPPPSKIDPRKMSDFYKVRELIVLENSTPLMTYEEAEKALAMEQANMHAAQTEEKRHI
ncbi:uncharacterized protein LOC117169226 [Belonocnema kinseyi]|uniref:uncharacterized protein LOC117169226 n=1 Tax=Belonocnema kinseyi TaxID=2817044 RepID=UPI00143D8E11|nr:uncharacterized protein LOC117169226 [Belonocnema kinseyi]